jgi:hypothetical protein
MSLPAQSSIAYQPNQKHQEHPPSNDSDDDESLLHPDQKNSRKDNYLINTMIKLNDTMDKSSRTREEKDPGFNRLERQHQKLILHASAVPPFDSAGPNPTEFYPSFLAKKSQFKAKKMLMHRFQVEKIAFHPNPTFVTNLWNSDLFWLLPDSSSGISIFYCPEKKFSNYNELEKERNLALANKKKSTDIEKLSKQKIFLPTTVMDLIRMTQKFHAVISLCFGPESHSSIYLKEWANHI